MVLWCSICGCYFSSIRFEGGFIGCCMFLSYALDEQSSNSPNSCVKFDLISSYLFSSVFWSAKNLRSWMCWLTQMIKRLLPPSLWYPPSCLILGLTMCLILSSAVMLLTLWRWGFSIIFILCKSGVLSRVLNLYPSIRYILPQILSLFLF